MVICNTGGNIAPYSLDLVCMIFNVQILNVSVLMILMVRKLLHKTNWKNGLHQLFHFNFRENQSLGRTTKPEAWGFIVAEHKSQRYDSCYSISYLKNQKPEIVLRRINIGKYLYPSLVLNSRSVIYIYCSVTPLLCCSNTIILSQWKTTVTKGQNKSDDCMKLNRLKLRDIHSLHLLR